jgi:hypothetical protein
MIIFESENLSTAWANSFLYAMEHTERIMPLIYNIKNINGKKITEIEDQVIKETLDKTLNFLDEKLKKLNCYSIETVAETIFPKSLLKITLPLQEAAADLYERYIRMFPQLRVTPANKYGTYFYRFINYQSKSTNKKEPFENQKSVNQLERIVSAFKNGVKRSSALQIMSFNPIDDEAINEEEITAKEIETEPLPVFEPTQDLVASIRRGFPCLQQISLSFDKGTNGLRMVALYANQHIVTKAYGNLLGLCYLGEFLAEQMGLNFDQLTCIATVGQLDAEITKRDLLKLKSHCKSRLLEIGAVDISLNKVQAEFGFMLNMKS